jgi:hypothetical protein
MSENGGAPLRSATITGLATARAMLRPLGFTRERLARPNIGRSVLPRPNWTAKNRR